MANILFCLAQPIIENSIKNIVCYYDGMIKELRNDGNNICLLNIVGFSKITNKQKEDIKKFNPDIIFAFNNAIFPEVINITGCPIVCFAEDSYYFFCQKDLLKKYRDRYYLVTTDGNINDFKSYFDINKMAPIHHATAVIRDNSPKDKNISFIGQPFVYGNLDQEQKHTGYKALLESYSKCNYDYKKLIQKYDNDKNWEESLIFGVFDNRIATLNTLLELGLSVYGIYWNNLSKYCNQLVLAFNEEPVYSLKHNQDIYNSSIININIQHPQNYGYGCAWRVYDIMASSGLLISQRSLLLKNRTKNFVDIPMFDTPLQAADLCRKYLKEKTLREEIIIASNEYIEKFGRWNSNFKTISQLTGISLKDTENKGYLSFINPNNLLQIKKYSRIKNIKNGYRLILSNLPIFRKLYNAKQLNKLYSSIEKNKII